MGNKRAWAAIGRTCARLVRLVRPERSPASGGGGVKFGKGEGSAGQHVAVKASGRPRGVVRRVGWLGVQAGDRAHRRLLCGGRRKWFSGEQAVRLGQQAGMPARWVCGEVRNGLRWQWSHTEQCARRRRPWRGRRKPGERRRRMLPRERKGGGLK
jgi:hypothetical protein